VAPDVGTASRAQKLARLLGPKVPVAIIDKRRVESGETEVFAIIGSVKGRSCVLVDDMIDGGGTIRSAEKCLYKKGAISVATYSTHLILSGEAAEKFQKARSHVVGTQTIPRSFEFLKRNAKWLEIMPIEPFLANAVHQASVVGGSMSKFHP
jgi:ribose-phosphate pyrophosphokinase